jgi:hypothetical protein
VDEAIPVANFASDAEAEMAAALLQRAGIPFIIRSGKTAGIQTRPGGADLLVRSQDYEEARQVLGDLGTSERAE